MSGPGSLLYRVAANACDHMTAAFVLDPWLADFQHEYSAANSGVERTWIRITYTAAWLRAFGYLVLRRDGVPRVVAVEFVAILAMTAFFWMLTAPELLSRVSVERRMVIGLSLVPQALVMALPFGSCLGVLLSMRDGMKRSSRLALIGSAVVCALMTGAVLQWVLPDANQTFRVTYIQRPVRRGFGEMSLTALAAHASRGSEALGQSARGELQARLTLIVAPVALTLFLLNIAARIRFPRVFGAVLIYVFYVYFINERALIQSHDSAARMFAIGWVPSLALIALSFAFSRFATKRQQAAPE